MNATGVVHNSSTVQSHLHERWSVAHYDSCECSRTIALRHCYYDAFARLKHNRTRRVLFSFKTGRSINPN
jgi:hypothetical protein